jgi:ornithine cyclodeaminase/alanine dehydrogenase-like protein (mu-crystallin family)
VLFAIRGALLAEKVGPGDAGRAAVGQRATRLVPPSPGAAGATIARHGRCHHRAARRALWRLRRDQPFPPTERHENAQEIHRPRAQRTFGVRRAAAAGAARYAAHLADPHTAEAIAMIPEWIDGARVRRELTYDACIAAMHDALRAFSRGEALQPLRTVVRLPDGRGTLYVMPAYSASPRALSVKLISVFEGNAARGVPTHQGVIVVFDSQTGGVRACIDAAAVTAIRTAAVSAVATRVLARPDAARLSLLGAGVQARSHLRAIARVRPLARVRIWSRTPERARAFAAEHADFGIPIEAVSDAAVAAEAADIICTVTSSQEPVLRSDWVAAGTHINAVGASLPTAREIEGTLVGRARIFVDSREAALAEAGDLLLARVEGSISDEDIVGELGELLDGRITGRRDAGEITLFKSLGLAIEDAAAAALLLDDTR